MGAISYLRNKIKKLESSTAEKANQADLIALGTRVDETKIKVLDVEQDVSNISKVLTNLNPDQEAKQSISGYGILSLPKNAANGQVSDVVIKGRTITNLLGSDGNFESAVDGVGTGFTAVYINNASVADNIQTYTATAVSGGIRKVMPFVDGHKYYARVLLKCDSNKVSLELFGGLGGRAFAVGNNVFETVSIIATYDSATMANFQRIQTCDTRTSDWTPTQCQKFIVVDLTATYGAGNEPTKEWCDSNINFVNNTKSTVSGRLKKIETNKFNKNQIPKARYAAQETVLDTGIKVKSTVSGTSQAVEYSMQLNPSILQHTLSVNMSTITGGSYVNIKDSITKATITGSNTSGSLTFATPSHGKIDITFYSTHSTTAIGEVNYTNIMLNEGTTALPYVEYSEQNAYHNGTLRSLPNGTKDEVNVTEGKATQNVSEDIVVSDTVYDTLDTSTYTNVDVVITTAFADAKAGTTGADGQTHYYNKDGVELVEVAQADIDLEASAGKYYWGEDKKLYIIVAKGDYADIAAARTGLGTTTLTYQLAQPIEANVPAQMLTGGPNHTIMWLPEVADAGIYDGGISILSPELPIKELKKIVKIDFMTGAETELDIATAEISGDKKSFTHPELTDGDIVFFEYEYPPELSTVPEMEVSYLDSRYVIQDSENEKYYTWKITSANGVASIVLTEVV
jgi:hypothetical protein